MNRPILSTIFMFILTISCRTDGEPIHDPMLAIDEALVLFFKYPSQPDRSVSILKDTCNGKSELAATGCYNLGILYEYLNEPKKAAGAYQRAYQKESSPLYRNAILALDPTAAPPQKNPALRLHEELLQSCIQNRNNQKAALGSLRKLAELPEKERPSSEYVGQPIFRECLHNNREYESLLAKFASRPTYPQKRADAIRIEKDPFRVLWDMRSHLTFGARALTKEESRIDHPVTRAWSDFLIASKANNEEKSIQALQKFQTLLSNYMQSGKSPPDTKKRALAMLRASSLLIEQHPRFAVISKNEKIKEMTAPFIKIEQK